MQVIIIPIPGQVIAFFAGFVFGWERGVVYTMVGLTIGMTLVFNLSRRLGRRFVDRLRGARALREFEDLFLKAENKAGGLYEKSREAIRSHGLLTFFLIMLLPGFPDNLACFVAGLTRVPIRKLLLAAILGRFPSMLVLCLLGDGWSNAQGRLTLFIVTAVALILTITYLCNKDRIEKLAIQLLVKRRT